MDDLNEALAIVSAGMRKGENDKEDKGSEMEGNVDDVESIENGIIIDDEGISDVSHLRNGIVINPSKVYVVDVLSINMASMYRGGLNFRSQVW